MGGWLGSMGAYRPDPPRFLKRFSILSERAWARDANMDAARGPEGSPVTPSLARQRIGSDGW